MSKHFCFEAPVVVRELLACDLERHDVYVRRLEVLSVGFQRLMKEKRLRGYRHDGFWAMDTFKEQQELTDLYNSGQAPWEVWKRRDP